MTVESYHQPSYLYQNEIQTVFFRFYLGHVSENYQQSIKVKIYHQVMTIHLGH